MRTTNGAIFYTTQWLGGHDCLTGLGLSQVLFVLCTGGPQRFLIPQQLPAIGDLAGEAQDSAFLHETIIAFVFFLGTERTTPRTTSPSVPFGPYRWNRELSVRFQEKMSSGLFRAETPSQPEMLLGVHSKCPFPFLVGSYLYCIFRSNGLRSSWSSSVFC